MTHKPSQPRKRDIAWRRARFIASAPKVEILPLLRDDAGKLVPEIAILGRSNVGKSSLLNFLFDVKGLAKTSSVPGKTQVLNLFAIDNSLAFADLPGYGYAKVPDSVRRAWAPMARGYFERRQALCVILWLFDIRRLPTDEDRELLAWLCRCQKAVIMVVTKADQINKSQRLLHCQRIRSALGSEDLFMLPVSVHEGLGRKELIEVLADAVHIETQAAIQVKTQVKTKAENQVTHDGL